MSDLFEALAADLTAEGDSLRAAVAGLTPAEWATPTPAEGWTIAHQIAHLAWTDTAATLAAHVHRSDADQQAWDDAVLAAFADPEHFVDRAAAEWAAYPDLMQRWDDGRPVLVQALRELPDGVKMPWFGPPMAAASMATARYMETWAHGLDVFAALGRAPERTDRIKHVAHIGVRTRGYSFANNGLETPSAEVRVELTAPSGELWTWGPDDAPERVTGSAWDFCELVTQRVHRNDTDLIATGPGADAWLDIAQCFAGPAGGGRAPKEGTDA